MLELAERRRDRTWIDLTLRPVLSVAVARGDWNSAREVSRRYPSGVPAIPVTMFIDQMLGDAGFGDLDIGLRPQASSCHMLAMVARVTGDSGVLALAESNAVNLLKSADHLPPWWERAPNLSLAIVAVERGDKDPAERLYRSLLSTHQYYAWPLCSDRVLGLLSQTMGNLDQAETHFEDGRAFCRRAGYRPELAWTCCDYADALLERNGEGDKDRAIYLLDESLAISSELDMRPLMERVLSRREILKA